MKENAIYFAKNEFYQLIRDLGGSWNDSKERPIVCLIKSSENESLYWAVPMGKFNHRDEKAQKRINRYLNKNENTIESCYYHIGRTTTKSIFFISDAVPITDKYIEREYLGYDKKLYIIQNNNLVEKLEGKLKRILSYENSNRNHFRQHISDLKDYLLKELSEENGKVQEVDLGNDKENENLEKVIKGQTVLEEVVVEKETDELQVANN